MGNLTLYTTRDPRIVQSFKSKCKVASAYFQTAVQIVRGYFEYLVIRNYFTMHFINTYKLQYVASVGSESQHQKGATTHYLGDIA